MSNLAPYRTAPIQPVPAPPLYGHLPVLALPSKKEHRHNFPGLDMFHRLWNALTDKRFQVGDLWRCDCGMVGIYNPVKSSLKYHRPLNDRFGIISCTSSRRHSICAATRCWYWTVATDEEWIAAGGIVK